MNNAKEAVVGGRFKITPNRLVCSESGDIAWGRFIGQVDDANLKACLPLYRSGNKNDKRLKEWQAFQLSDSNKFVCGVLYNAKLFAVVAVSYYDRKSGDHFLYKKFVYPSSLSIADGTLPSQSKYEKKGITFCINRDMNLKETNISLYWPGTSKLPEFNLDVSMFEETPGMTICQPFRKQRPLYSYKNIMPATASLTLAGARVFFDKDIIGIIDDHKGYYPQTVNYDWGTAGACIDNKIIGFNLTRNQVLDPEENNENCLWLDGELFFLPAIHVTHHDNYWHYQDDKGMIDLRFTPMVNNIQKFHLGLVYMDYQGPFGLFDGFINHPQAGKVAIHKMLGMAERKRYKL